MFPHEVLVIFLVCEGPFKGSTTRQLGVSYGNSPARSDGLDDDDPHAISHLVCEAH